MEPPKDWKDVLSVSVYHWVGPGTYIYKKKTLQMLETEDGKEAGH